MIVLNLHFYQLVNINNYNEITPSIIATDYFHFLLYTI
jgi:hypothetical protein